MNFFVGFAFNRLNKSESIVHGGCNCCCTGRFKTFLPKDLQNISKCMKCGCLVSILCEISNFSEREALPKRVAKKGCGTADPEEGLSSIERFASRANNMPMVGM